jgi:hypothetical protein
MRDSSQSGLKLFLMHLGGREAILKDSTLALAMWRWLCSSSSMADRWTSAAAARVYKAPASSSATSACFSPKKAAVRPLLPIVLQQRAAWPACFGGSFAP